VATGESAAVVAVDDADAEASLVEGGVWIDTREGTRMATLPFRATAFRRRVIDGRTVVTVN
jgi:hypothetical protein